MEQQPVDYMKQNSEKNVWGKKIIFFLRHIGKMNLKKCWQIVSIWYSILFLSLKSLGNALQTPEKVWGSV